MFFIVLVTAGATVLSFPIPALLGGAAAVGGYLVSFVVGLTVSRADSVWADVFEAAMRGLLPDLAGATVSGLVAGGVLVPAGLVAWEILVLVLVRGGALAALGACLAARQEVGA